MPNFGVFFNKYLFIDNYWTELRKILGFVNMCRSWRLRKIVDLWDTDKSQYFVLTKFNINCFIIRSLSLFFNNIIICKAICHFHKTATARRRKAWFHLCMSRMLFAAKHSWTTLSMSRPLLNCRQLSAGHIMCSQPVKNEEKFALNGHYLRLQKNSSLEPRNLVDGCFLCFEFIHLC